MMSDRIKVGTRFFPTIRGEVPAGVEMNPDDVLGRAVMRVVASGPGWVTDGTSGLTFEWEPADCGADCFCAAVAWLANRGDSH